MYDLWLYTDTKNCMLCIYFQIKRMFKGDRKTEISIGERFASGSLAGATAQTIIYPMEVRIYRYW